MCSFPIKGSSFRDHQPSPVSKSNTVPRPVTGLAPDVVASNMPHAAQGIAETIIRVLNGNGQMRFNAQEVVEDLIQSLNENNSKERFTYSLKEVFTRLYLHIDDTELFKNFIDGFKQVLPFCVIEDLKCTIEELVEMIDKAVELPTLLHDMSNAAGREFDDLADKLKARYPKPDPAQVSKFLDSLSKENRNRLIVQLTQKVSEENKSTGVVVQCIAQLKSRVAAPPINGEHPQVVVFRNECREVAIKTCDSIELEVGVKAGGFKINYSLAQEVIKKRVGLLYRHPNSPDLDINKYICACMIEVMLDNICTQLETQNNKQAYIKNMSTEHLATQVMPELRAIMENELVTYKTEVEEEEQALAKTMAMNLQPTLADPKSELATSPRDPKLFQQTITYYDALEMTLDSPTKNTFELLVRAFFNEAEITDSTNPGTLFNEDALDAGLVDPLSELLKDNVSLANDLYTAFEQHCKDKFKGDLIAILSSRLHNLLLPKSASILSSPKKYSDALINARNNPSEETFVELVNRYFDLINQSSTRTNTSFPMSYLIIPLYNQLKHERNRNWLLRAFQKGIIKKSFILLEATIKKSSCSPNGSIDIPEYPRFKQLFTALYNNLKIGLKNIKNELTPETTQGQPRQLAKLVVARYKETGELPTQRFLNELTIALIIKLDEKNHVVSILKSGFDDLYDQIEKRLEKTFKEYGLPNHIAAQDMKKKVTLAKKMTDLCQEFLGDYSNLRNLPDAIHEHPAKKLFYAFCEQAATLLRPIIKQQLAEDEYVIGAPEKEFIQMMVALLHNNKQPDQNTSPKLDEYIDKQMIPILLNKIFDELLTQEEEFRILYDEMLGQMKASLTSYKTDCEKDRVFEKLL